MAARRRRRDKSGAWIAEGGRGQRAQRWRWYLDERIVNEGPRWRFRGRYVSRATAVGEILLTILNTLPDPWRGISTYYEKEHTRWAAWASDRFLSVEEYVDQWEQDEAKKYVGLENKIKAPASDVDPKTDMRALRRWDRASKRRAWSRYLRGQKQELLLQATLGFAGRYGAVVSGETTTAGFYPLGSGEAWTRTSAVHDRRMQSWTESVPIGAGTVLLVQPAGDETKAIHRGRRGRRVSGKRTAGRNKP